jgi:hypothetical protein
MTLEEQVEYLMTLGYRPITGPDGWVSMPSLRTTIQLSPERWERVQRWLDMPENRKPPVIPPVPSPEAARKAREAPRASRLPPSSQRPAPPPRPAQARAPAPSRADREEVEPLF